MTSSTATPTVLIPPHDALNRDDRALAIELIATSTSRSSVSAHLLDRIRVALEARHVSVGWNDRRDLGHAEAGQDSYPPEYVALKSRVQAADAIILAHGVYGYSVPGPTKTLADILSPELAAKPFAIVTAAGSSRSHLAVRDLACSIVFENESPWIPLTVQVAPDPAFPDVDPVDNPITEARIQEFVEGVIDFVSRLSGVRLGQAARS